MTDKKTVPPLVDTVWLSQHLESPGVRVVEIAGMGQEDQLAYRSGHIPGAACWNWKTTLWDSHIREFPTPGEFARRLGTAGIGEDTTVVIYGEPVQFGLYAWWTLRYCGHPDVRVLDGGRRGWMADGLPLDTREPPAPAPVVHSTAPRQEHMRIGRAEVLAATRRAGAVILDARSQEEYRGERVGAPGSPDVGAVRYGRIPGARHLEYLELLDADQRFKPAAQLHAALAARGAHANDDIITYCRMSHRATVLYFAMTELLGYEKVRVYDGSWTEWGNVIGLPIERPE
jgi:thiosulfate/3-mercaptopyruvate sulfurtransferase